MSPGPVAQDRSQAQSRDRSVPGTGPGSQLVVLSAASCREKNHHDCNYFIQLHLTPVGPLCERLGWEAEGRRIILLGGRSRGPFKCVLPGFDKSVLGGGLGNWHFPYSGVRSSACSGSGGASCCLSERLSSRICQRQAANLAPQSLSDGWLL